MDDQNKAFQDYYPDDVSHCYGCGRLNPEGNQLKSFWEGEESVAYFTPRPHHTAVPGFVYGGLLASLIDCHGTGTASAASYRFENRPLGSDPVPRFVTASLKVDYLRPTPLGPQLEVRGRVKEATARKVITEIRVLARGVECVRGEVVAVKIPESMLAELARSAAGPSAT